MSQFNYKHLQEEDDCSNDVFNNSTTTTANQNEDALASLTTNGIVLKQTTQEAVLPKNEDFIRNQSSPHCDIKYTALRPTRVVEEGLEDGADNDDYGSLVRLDLVKVHRKRKLRRFHVLICVLLGLAVILIAFCLLYVFVIVPAINGKVMLPDGQMHTADLAKLKKLGKNVVVTKCGLVRGVEEGRAYVFKGIPYAFPPTGSRRWKAPKPRSYDSETCWHDVHNATRFGHKCVQPKFNDNTAIEGNEDCLFLNVWTPSLKPASNLPVMVWLHSGDFVHGSGHMNGMSPSSEVAKTTKAVYVSLNYRLGVFGFLALDVLREGREAGGAAGNYGIMDQLLALKWIADNIRSFGGNQFDITVFGHGSGATSIQTLLASHWSHGLFHRAWISSPVAILNKTLEEACVDNKKILEHTKCESAHCLRSLSAEKLVKASPWSLDPFWTLDQLFDTPFHSQIRNGLAIFDGHIAHLTPEKEGPIGVDVPVVLGTTYFELSSLLTEKAVINMTDNEFNDVLVHHTSSYGTDTAIQMKRLYSHLPHLQYSSPVHFPPRASASMAHLIGDIRNVCPLKFLASSMEYVYSSPVYMYTAEIYPSHNILLSSSETNSFVGWDIIAFFYSFNDLNFAVGQGDINFRNVMRQEIMSFVRKGKPISKSWQTVEHNTGIIERGVTVKPASSDYFEHCDFWDQHLFFDYSWRVRS